MSFVCHVRSTRRRASARPSLAPGEPLLETASGRDSIEQAMLGWQVAAALERLTPDHRQMIRLAHLQGMSVREIAEALGAEVHEKTPLFPLVFYQKNCNLLAKMSLEHEWMWA